MAPSAELGRWSLACLLEPSSGSFNCAFHGHEVYSPCPFT